MSGKNIISVKNLTKKFNDFTAVDRISFSIKEGEIFAFLGPNGAGKSTTIKMLTTILKPTSGKLSLNGFNVCEQKNKVRESIGVIFQDSSVDDDLTAYENMKYHAIMYKVPKNETEKRIEKLLDYVNLLDRKNDLVKKFSGGMKRRLEIARGLLHEPKILFLDEPTLGLDVQTRTFLWKYIKKINKEKGITIFFTTHNLDEAERVAQKISIIDHGKILASGTSSEIKKSTKTDSLEKAFLKITGYGMRKDSAENSHMKRMKRMGRR